MAGITSFQERVEFHERHLIDLYGSHLLVGASLRAVLGFRTGSAFRQAVRRARLPVPTFIAPGRRGRMATVLDVARWMAALEQKISPEESAYGVARDK